MLLNCNLGTHFTNKTNIWRGEEQHFLLAFQTCKTMFYFFYFTKRSIVPYIDENPRVRAMKILHRAFSCPDDQTNNISYLYKLHLSQIKELAICQPNLVRGPSITFPNENQSIVPHSNAESVQYCTQNQKLYRIHSVRQNTQTTCYKKHCNTSTEQNE